MTRIRITIGARLVQTDFLQTSVLDSSQLHAFAFQDLITFYCMLIKGITSRLVWNCLRCVSLFYVPSSKNIKFNVGNSKACTKIWFSSPSYFFLLMFIKEAHDCGSTQTLIFPTKAQENESQLVLISERLPKRHWQASVQ